MLAFIAFGLAPPTSGHSVDDLLRTGMAKLATAHHAEAIVDFTQAIELDPQNAVA